MQLNILFLIIIILIFYIIKIKNIEKFAVADDVKEEINKVYQADLDAIRNLSAIASKLQAGGVTVPGNLTVTDNTTSNGFITTKGIRSNETWFPYSDGNNYIRGNTILDGSLTHNGSSNVTGVLTAGNVAVGAHEIQLQYNGKAHYVIINDGNFRIKNTSVNGAIGSAGTDLITVDTAGNTTIAGKVYVKSIDQLVYKKDYPVNYNAGVGNFYWTKFQTTTLTPGIWLFSGYTMFGAVNSTMCHGAGITYSSDSLEGNATQNNPNKALYISVSCYGSGGQWNHTPISYTTPLLTSNTSYNLYCVYSSNGYSHDVQITRIA